MAPTSENFYQYQQRRLGMLFSWGLGSIMLGSILKYPWRSFWKQFGL